MVITSTHTGANDAVSEHVNATNGVPPEVSIEIDDNDDCPPLIPNIQPVTDGNNTVEMDISSASDEVYSTFKTNTEIQDILSIKKDTSDNTDDIDDSLFPSLNHSCVSFIAYPFVLSPATKAAVLECDATMQMQRGMQREMHQAMMMGQQSISPYFVLRVSRERIVLDTLSQILLYTDNEFKKPLKVVFDDEEGVDAGGVRKEYYQLMTKQLLDPDYGMFRYYPDSRMLWFNSDSYESREEFELIGLMLGVAIFNSIIIDLRMPMVVYKKLKGQKSVLSDLAVLQPELALGLQKLLDFNGDVEGVFEATFQLSSEVFGEIITRDLIPHGGDIPVTNANRVAYVQAYVEYVLDVSVTEQFEAFQRGFRKVCGGDALDLFEAPELELLICGNPVLNFSDLRKGSTYEDGYSASSQAVEDMWKVLNEFDEIEKKVFLKFISGSDRSPIDGLSKLAFVVSKNGSDDQRLPSAHTCFNHLLLPAYSSVDVMREKIRYAMTQSEGFGLR